MLYFEHSEGRGLLPVADFILGSPVFERGGSVQYHKFSTSHKMSAELSTFVVDQTGLIYECLALTPPIHGEIQGTATVRGYGNDPVAIREEIIAAMRIHGIK